MYIRAKQVRYRDRVYDYLQLVESRREEDRNRQKVIATLGRLDRLTANGQIDRLIAGLSRFSETLRVVRVDRDDALAARSAKGWGPALVFGRLWQEQGLPTILRRLSDGRRFAFDFERVVFGLALQRLCEPGSDRQGAAWLETMQAPGFEDIRRHHMYRALPLLAEIREALEQNLFLADRDLFNRTLDLVCIDTTSTYVYREREHEGTMRRRGYSRDHRGDLLQFVLCLAVDRRGWPVAWDIFPGNTADKRAFAAMVKRLRERFRIGRVCVVGDRGMISRDTIALLTGHDSPWDYVLGCRLRNDAEVREVVLADGAPFETLSEGLEVKDVGIGGRRYVVCRNPGEAERDARMREAIVARLGAALAHGPKGVVRNRGYARFLRIERGAMSIDDGAVTDDARFDGIFVLRTSTQLPAAEVAALYKSLWRVERAFREVKATLDVRPLYHQNEEACIGHMAACFLALRLEVDLQTRLDAIGAATPWPDLMRDLGQVQSVLLDLDGKRYRLRTDLKGNVHQAFRAAGVRPPNRVTCLGPTPKVEPSET